MKAVARMLAAALGEMGVTDGCRAVGSDTILTLAAGEETLVGRVEIGIPVRLLQSV